ncbi:MAG: helix-turn-helix domain-containing protein [Acidobacteria bacterium]|nr:helix-turn-helix domain-containing protein [Acidobacteriota bacterium]MCA1648987.1 helix-turn-helix domain-containing protein [Acidobacteriota bacterium]
MSDRDTFGPRLRRERERRGITLDTIATLTKVSADLWDGLERNDFSRWPSGIFARAFVRDYARAVGLDADEIVDEFCRLFPVGDRRTSRVIKRKAELIGVATSYSDENLPPEGDRRASGRQDDRRFFSMKIAPRTLAVVLDLSCTLLSAAGVATLFHTSFWGSAGVVGIVYYSVSTMTAGASLGNRGVEILRQWMPGLSQSLLASR